MKLVAVQCGGILLLIAAVWLGIMMFYGREPWQFGGMALAWLLGAVGIALMGYTKVRKIHPTRTRQR
jgi:predicted membrane channel-forming protein YqfA (hemolysin III family)